MTLTNTRLYRHLSSAWRLCLCAAVLLTLLPAAAAAQSPGVTLEPLALYNGTVKYGEWLPVRVHLENDGADVTGRAQVRVGGAGQHNVTYAQPVELPRGARKDVTLYVLPNTFSRRLTVEFVAGGQDAEPLAQAEVAVQPVPNIRLISAAISGGGEGLDALAGLQLRTRRNDSMLVPLTLASLPERVEGLRSLDVLAVTGVDTGALAPAQREALVQWVALGGTLVLGGGPLAERTLSGLPETLRPVDVVGETALDRLPELERVAGEAIRVAGPFPAAESAPHAASTVRVEQDGVPLVVARRVGRGAVLWLALDPALSPFDAWAGADAFWTNLIAEFVAYPAHLPPDVSPRQMGAEQIGYALSNLPSLDLPSLRLLAPLLLVYILVVGPLNYLVLRWQRRLELGWVTVPAITLVFSAGAYAIGFQLRGGDVIVNQISTLEVQANNPAGTAYVRSFVGIFSPARREYDLELPGDLLVSPLTLQGGGPMFVPDTSASTSGSDLLILQGQPTSLRHLRVNQWSMQSFTIESGAAAAGASLEADLSTQGATIKGTIKNNSTQTWRDVVIAQGSSFQRLGDLEPGQQAGVKLALDTNLSNAGGPPLSWQLFQDQLNSTGPGGPPREVQIKQQVLDSIFNGPFGPTLGAGGESGSGPLLIAWADAPPFSVTLPEYRVSAVGITLIYSRLPLRFGSGEISLPPGIVVPQMEAESNRFLCYSPRGPGLAPDFDEMAMRFQLPADLGDFEPTELVLHVSSDGGWFSPPQLSLWAWEQSEWVSAGDNLQIGANPVADPDRFVRDGVIRVRATNETRDRGGCLYFDIALKGQRG